MMTEWLVSEESAGNKHGPDLQQGVPPPLSSAALRHAPRGSAATAALCQRGCHFFASLNWHADVGCSLEAIVITICYVTQQGLKKGQTVGLTPSVRRRQAATCHRH